MAAVRVVISGRVQGVGFRAFVERRARKHGVRGWVRNRRRGPSLAVVSRLDRFDATDDGAEGFKARPTE